MKKLFVEPEVKRIEINIKENIASSGNRPLISFTFTWIDPTCMVQNAMNLNDFMAGNYKDMTELEVASKFPGCYELKSASATFNGVHYTLR